MQTTHKIKRFLVKYLIRDWFLLTTNESELIHIILEEILNKHSLTVRCLLHQTICSQLTTCNSVVILQPISPPYISNSSMQLTCPNCRANVLTKINYKLGALPWLLCGGLCLFGLWCGCQFIPFCMNSCKDVEHYCSNCNRFLGVNRRI
jgi:lipopolysaccharide-induced tumor necrosis factor-alpha factor